MDKPICSNCNDTGTDDFGGDMCANCNGCNSNVPDDLNLAPPSGFLFPEPGDYPVGEKVQGRRWKVADDIAADDPDAVIH